MYVLVVGSRVEDRAFSVSKSRLWEENYDQHLPLQGNPELTSKALMENPIIVMPELQDETCNRAWLLRAENVVWGERNVFVSASRNFEIIEFPKGNISKFAKKFGLSDLMEKSKIALNREHVMLIRHDIQNESQILSERMGPVSNNGNSLAGNGAVADDDHIQKLTSPNGIHLTQGNLFDGGDLTSYRTIEVESVAEMVNVVAKFSDHIMSGIKKEVPRFWFRGVTSDEYNLTPKIYRDTEPYLKQFRGSGREIMRELEPRMIARFTERAAPHLESHANVGDLWSMLFVMQHYGAPTRLLDWSENLLVAAHFAAGDRTNIEEKGRPTVWVLQPGLWNRAARDLGEDDTSEVLTTGEAELDRYEPRDHSTSRSPTLAPPVAIYSRHSSARIVSQQGVFTIAGSEVSGIDVQLSKWISVNRASGDELLKIVFTGQRERMRHELDSIGSSLSIIYPGLESICKELDRLVTD